MQITDDSYDRMMSKIGIYENALKEIMKARGAFNRDPIKHAENCINDMKQIAQDALDLKPIETEGGTDLDMGMGAEADIS